MSPSFVIGTAFAMIIALALAGFVFAAYRLYAEWQDAPTSSRMQARDNLVAYLAINGLLVALGIIVTSEAMQGFRSFWSANAINTVTGLVFFVTTGYVCFRKKRLPASI